MTGPVIISPIEHDASTSTNRWRLLGSAAIESGVHLGAFAVAVGLMTIIPVIAYFVLVLAGILFAGDPGGLLNLILVPLLSVALALASGLAAAPLVIITRMLARYHLIWYIGAPVIALVAGCALVLWQPLLLFPLLAGATSFVIQLVFVAGVGGLRAVLQLAASCLRRRPKPERQFTTLSPVPHAGGAARS